VEFLKDRLATFKLPERIEFMESLPLSENGKVLKGELLARLAAAGPHP
jgi:long-chain acyl-CoA synthetase